MEVTEELIKDYNLDYELTSSSEPAMITQIGEAVKNKEPIVAPLWSPHWIFAEYDLKFLEDPKKYTVELRRSTTQQELILRMNIQKLASTSRTGK